MTPDPALLRAVAERALEHVKDGATIGLGTGHAAQAFVYALRDRVRAGLKVRGVPTSESTQVLAEAVDIQLTTLDEVDRLDVAVDGADEVDPAGNLIKGYGGALIREKIVAAAAGRLIILVGPEKVVSVLGGRGIVPVEIVPFGEAATMRHLRRLGCEPVRRMDGKEPFVSDNGNTIFDCRVGPIADPARLDDELHRIPGVVGTGLFVGFAPIVIIGHEGSVEVRDHGVSTGAST
jgi:ribose 5-phosphate isomerase A